MLLSVINCDIQIFQLIFFNQYFNTQIRIFILFRFSNFYLNIKPSKYKHLTLFSGVKAMSLTKMKAETQSRMSQEKRTTERKRNIIVLIEKYLLSLGYIDSVTKIEQQTNISLQKWDTADNLDLYMIVMEYQQFYEMKFNKYPKLCKLAGDGSVTQQMKKAALKTKQINSSINKGQGTPSFNSKRIQLSNQANFKKKDSVGQKSEKSQKNIQSKPESMQIQGNSVSNKQKKKEDQQQMFDARVLKGIPDYSSVPQYRQLAAYLQRDILVQNPNVKFEDIVGLQDAKRLLKQAVLLPLKYQKLFTGLLEPWKGVLLFGPPGTGKTMLAKSVATQCKTTFFNISASSVVSKWRGQSQKLIRVLFQLARWYQPSTIFIDEIDSIMSQRGNSGAQHEGGRRMKTQLLIQMDGVIKKNERVFLLAASNLPWDLDIAMLRRLQKRILVDLPCLEARQAMLRMYLPEGSMANGLDYEETAKILQGYSGSDIKLVCKEAAMKPLRRLLFKLEQIEVKQSAPHNKFKKSTVNQDQIKPQPVTMNDIQQSVKTTKKSPGLQTKKYMRWVQQFGSV